MEEEYTPSLQEMRDAFALYFANVAGHGMLSPEWKKATADAEAAFDRGLSKVIRKHQDSRMNILDDLSIAQDKLAQIREILEQE